MTTIQSLISDAQNHLNGRQRGREARLARLAAGGVPTDEAGMARWLSDALDADLEASGGLYHACTVRASNGCDPELPMMHGIGCRITRVPVKAHLVAAGDVIEEDADGNAVLAEEPFFAVHFGAAGTGFLRPTFDTRSTTAEEAECRAREAMLASGECFRTRAEARAAVERMLRARVQPVRGSFLYPPQRVAGESV